MDIKSIKDKIEKFKEKKILVVGDIVLDEFMYTEIKRISREAPVFICSYQTSDFFPGCAGNTVSNVISLQGKVFVAGVVGNDEDGKNIKSQFEKIGVVCSYLHLSDKTSTMKKTRILAGGVHRAKQHMLRVDKEFQMDNLLEFTDITDNLKSFDGIIISDYGYNTITPENSKTIIQKANNLNIPIFVDSRYRTHLFQNVNAITPNEEEAENILQEKIPNNGEQLLKALNKIARICNCQIVLLTRGSNGLVVYSKKENSYTYFPVFGSKEAVDVSGAGDSVISAFSLSLVSGLDYITSAFVANISGGISVMKKGTYSVTNKELLEALNDKNIQKGTTFKNN
jgi:rfaE bifunctional protein kinase chain/domain